MADFIIGRVGALALAVLSAPIVFAQAPLRLETTNFIVMGEGLAAGMGDFGLHETWQQASFGAVMAKSFNTIHPMPAIQAPGIGNPPGWPVLESRVPGRWQSTVRSGSTPSLFIFNLSVPGLRLEDALSRPPREPLVQTADPLQTSVNLILGFPALVLGSGRPLWTQVQYAAAMRPTLVVVALGYTEACEAAVAGDATLLPAPNQFRASFDRVLAALAATNTETIVLTIPDPFDTAYFEPGNDGIFLAAPARPYVASGEAAPAGMTIAAAAASRVSAGVVALNREIAAAAQARDATLADLHALFGRWRREGLAAGPERLTAAYLGGIYNFSGFYPGHTGHAAIANTILTAVNSRYGRNFALADLASISRTDPAVRYRPTAASERVR